LLLQWETAGFVSLLITILISTWTSRAGNKNPRLSQ
jgi:hypothetical protein